MEKKSIRAFTVLMMLALITASFTGCAKISYVFNNGVVESIHEIKDGSWKESETPALTPAETNDESVLEKSFEAGTYGGIEFNSFDDVIAFYNEAYDYTKALTAEYDVNGETKTYYKLLGTEKMTAENILIDGSKNSMINNLAPGIIDGAFAPSPYGLVPSSNCDPNEDNNLWDDSRKHDIVFDKSLATADDVLDANIVDNGDGTITITIQPKAVNLSIRGEDAQGHFFQSLGDIQSAIGSVGNIISFSQGSGKDNITVDYRGGTATVTVDTKTKEILSADYIMKVNLQLTHLNIAVIKDKSASVTIVYENHFPANDEFLKDTRGIVRK